jgi:hypothetical protein
VIRPLKGSLGWAIAETASPRTEINVNDFIRSILSANSPSSNGVCCATRIGLKP